MRCYILVQHKVREYTQWQIIFNNSQEWRQAMGEKHYQIFTDVDDINKISLLLEWENIDKAKLFIADSQLSEYMQHAGVIDLPIIHLLNKN
jgi:hypothetical protein